ADSNGIFSLNAKLKWKDITLVASSVGFGSSEVSLNRERYNSNIVISLKQNKTLDSVVVTSFETGLVRMGGVCYRVSTRSHIEPEKKPSSSNLQIYPNPVPSNSTLHIEWKQKDFGYHALALLNQSGQLVFSKEIYIDQEAKLLDI